MCCRSGLRRLALEGAPQATLYRAATLGYKSVFIYRSRLQYGKFI
jgi:hypothetical protein